MSRNLTFAAVLLSTLVACAPSGGASTLPGAEAPIGGLLPRLGEDGKPVKGGEGQPPSGGQPGKGRPGNGGPGGGGDDGRGGSPGYGDTGYGYGYGDTGYGYGDTGW